MKRIFSGLLAAVLALSLVGCGSSNTEEPAGLTGTLTEIVEDIYENVETEIFLRDPYELDITSEDSVSYYLGLTSADGISEVVVSEASMSAVAYCLCVIRVEENADVESLKTAMLEGVNPARWLCVEAEQVMVSSCGDVILLVLGSTDMIDQVQTSFAALAGEGLGDTTIR